MEDKPDTSLILFLRNLADSIEQKHILPSQLQSIGEFFMKYQFQTQAIKDNDTSKGPSSHFSHEELLKFVVLGWYIYRCILDNDPLPDVD
jgi:hypothetical protein